MKVQNEIKWDGDYFITTFCGKHWCQIVEL